jgi:hypothetical protein
MNLSRFLPRTISFVLSVLFILSAAGCAGSQQSDYPATIDAARKALQLPRLPLEYVEMTGMANSPSGATMVNVYQDSAGRKYSGELTGSQVVEIDARVVLANLPANARLLSDAELKARAWQYVRAMIPNFDSLQSSLRYEQGSKGKNYFYSWYAEMSPGATMPPFIQIALHQSGIVFAYYNTLTLK